MLLRGTSLSVATNALVRVKSHYPDVDLAKIKGGANTTKELKAMVLKVEEAAMECNTLILLNLVFIKIG
jgi:hypothetical protein